MATSQENSTFVLYPLLIKISLGAILYLAIGAVYRLYFSPIASFPGPKLAALTLWYEFYYDVILGGQYTFHLRKLHARYGPIVRINPYELHISDSDFYEKLYASGGGGQKRDKWDWMTKQLDTPGSMFSTPGHQLHKARRAALNHFFSSASIKRLQPLIDRKVEDLLGRLRLVKDRGEVIKIDIAFTAMTNDIIQEYAYGRSDNCLEDPSFSTDFHHSAITAAKLGPVMKQMDWFCHMMLSLPDSLISRISPDLYLILGLQRKVENQIREIMAEPPKANQKLEHPTMFHELLQSDLPVHEKSVDRLRDEAWVIVAGGTNTSAWALSVAVYHLLTSPLILTQLKRELKTALPDYNRDSPTPISRVENLPYLGAIVKEALRLSYGAATRLQRLSPEPLTFTDRQTQKEWIIPPNTPCGMTSIHVHHDESVFPNSDAFIPERWIQDARLDRYLVSFSKGTRMCVGITLAYAELYTCLARMFRLLGSVDVGDEEDEGFLELYETDISDLTPTRDFLLPLPRADSQGVRIKVRSCGSAGEMKA